MIINYLIELALNESYEGRINRFLRVREDKNELQKEVLAGKTGRQKGSAENTEVGGEFSLL
ncbi:MAG: hypothetical protein QXF21_02735, partial [Thermoproteota archaeon]